MRWAMCKLTVPLDAEIKAHLPSLEVKPNTSKDLGNIWGSFVSRSEPTDREKRPLDVKIGLW